MSVIKEIYDITKDITKSKNAQKKIKKAILLLRKLRILPRSHFSQLVIQYRCGFTLT